MTNFSVNLAQQFHLALRTPLSNGGDVALTAATRNQHAADLAEALRDLTQPEALAVFNWLDNERAAQVLGSLDAQTRYYVLNNAPSTRIVELLGLLPADDAAWLMAELEPEHAAFLLAHLQQHAPGDAREVRELLTYAEGTAGRLMTGTFIRLSAAMTVELALQAIRRTDDETETITDLYVVEQDGAREKLVGMLSLSALIRADGSTLISQLMTRDFLAAKVDQDQEEVARQFSKYDFLTMPVLDLEGYLMGIITVDDIIDVLAEEFNEDYMRFVGSDADEMDKKTPSQVAKMRLPWLMATLAIELCAGGVIARFDYVLREVILLASFMPVISAISGNVGLQAAAIVVRGLDTGHVHLSGWRRALSRELATAALMALACGLLLGVIGMVWSQHLTFGLVVGGAMTCSMITASLMGTLIPMLSKKLGFDPATSAGPFETAFQDVIGFAVFLWLASLLLPWLK